MFTSYSRLPPTTPPSTSAYADGVSIVLASNSTIYDSMYDEENLTSASCQMYPPPSNHASSSSYTLPPLAPQTSHAVASPYMPYAAPPQHDPVASLYPPMHPTLDLSTPALDLDIDEIPGRVEMDMGMAQSGTESALAGIQTPLAAYAAQMAVWLWHGQHSPSATIPVTGSPLLNSPNPFELSHPVSPLNPLQVSPSPEFVTFVERILRVTMVSHSVTLIALLYIYRLKQRNIIVGDAGSETRPFVVSLILGNKYLDDNTYTNATWAELAGLDLKDLNKMEKEFLKGLDYRLTVDRSDYQHWRNLLDGFIYARKREAAHAAYVHRHRPSWSPQTVIYTPVTTVMPTLPNTDINGRARSASPAQFYSSEHADNTYLYNAASPLHRKRTAVDAFAADVPDQSVVYEQMRLPARKAHFGSMDASYFPSGDASLSSGGLGRSSSLNRRIARLPGDTGRRGSLGQIHGASAAQEEPDLRHAAAMHLQHQEGYAPPQWQGYTSLIAPYEAAAHMSNVPPEHLMFYTLAAAPHPGFDGAPRKAILRYQHPAQQPYDYPAQPASTPAYPVYPNTIPSVEYPFQPTYAVPQPAQFANAGPPGYAYAPGQGSTRTGLGISGLYSVTGPAHGTPSGLAHQQAYPSAEDQQMSGLQQYTMDAGRARSQWSSPFTGHFDPHVWQQ